MGFPTWNTIPGIWRWSLKVRAGPAIVVVCDGPVIVLVGELPVVEGGLTVGTVMVLVGVVLGLVGGGVVSLGVLG